jgi:hypothetical protein
MVGALWYSPLLFLQRWLEHVGGAAAFESRMMHDKLVPLSFATNVFTLYVHVCMMYIFQVATLMVL